MQKVVKKQPPLQVVFAHHDQPLPSEFLNYAKPHQAIEQLSQRQLKKWKSQRMAFFLLHKIFEQYQLDTEQLKHIQRTPSGRPYLADPRIDFNISHSGDWVAIIFSLNQPKTVVGIDIEHPQKIRRYADLLRYYAKPQEIAEIENGQVLPQLDSLEKRFYLSWCLREAVLKSQGVGIVKLSEVQHSLSERIIRSAHCPQGTLCFYHQLPFYLAYFLSSRKLCYHCHHLANGKMGGLLRCNTRRLFIKLMRGNNAKTQFRRATFSIWKGDFRRLSVAAQSFVISHRIIISLRPVLRSLFID